MYYLIVGHLLIIRTRQLVQVQRNIEARSCNHCCSVKAINITYSDYSECVFVALVIQHALHMRLIFICGLSNSIGFFHIFS